MMFISFYGIAFMTLGNLAGNAVSLQYYLFEAFAPNLQNRGEPSSWRILAYLPAGLIIVLCMKFTPRGCIALNKVFVAIKIGILVTLVWAMIFHTSTAAAGSMRHYQNLSQEEINAIVKAIGGTHRGVEPLMGSVDRILGVSNVVYFYEAFAMFAYHFSDFKRPNGILSQIANLGKYFRRAIRVFPAVIASFCLFSNFHYFWDIFDKYCGTSHASTMIYSSLLVMITQGYEKITWKQCISAFLALSSIGNLLIMTSTACRVQEEMVKEGILPYPLATWFFPDWSWIKSCFQPKTNPNMNSPGPLESINNILSTANDDVIIPGNYKISVDPDLDHAVK
jgi:hypothetical protein